MFGAGGGDVSVDEPARSGAEERGEERSDERRLLAILICSILLLLSLRSSHPLLLVQSHLAY